MKARQLFFAASALAIATLFSSCAVDGYGYYPGYDDGGRYYASQRTYATDYYPDSYAGYYPDDYYYGASYYNPYATGLLLTGGYWNTGHHHYRHNHHRSHHSSWNHRRPHVSGHNHSNWSGSRPSGGWNRTQGSWSGGSRPSGGWSRPNGSWSGGARPSGGRPSGGWSGGTRSGGGHSAMPAPSRIAPQRQFNSGSLPPFKGAVSRGGSGGHSLRSSGNSSGQKSGRLGRD